MLEKMTELSGRGNAMNGSCVVVNKWKLWCDFLLVFIPSLEDVMAGRH